MFTFTAHEGPVTSVAFAGPTGLLLSTGVDGCVRLWNPVTREELLAVSAADPAAGAEASGLLCAAADHSGRFAAVGLRTRGVEFLDLDSGREAGRFALTQMLDLTPAPDGHSLFVLGGGMRTLWRTYVCQITYPDGRELARTKGGGGGGSRVAVTQDGSEVLVGGRRFLWPSGVAHELPLQTTGRINAPRVISHDKDKLFAPVGSRLGVWSYLTGVARQRLKGHVAPITALVLTPDGRKLWTASADATVKRWDVDTYASETTYRFPAGPLSCLAVSPDGSLAAAGCSHKGTVTVWDLS